jgi:hypothetical protein
MATPDMMSTPYQRTSKGPSSKMMGFTAFFPPCQLNELPTPGRSHLSGSRGATHLGALIHALRPKDTVHTWRRRAGRDRRVAPVLSQMRLPYGPHRKSLNYSTLSSIIRMVRFSRRPDWAGPTSRPSGATAAHALCPGGGSGWGQSSTGETEPQGSRTLDPSSLPGLAGFLADPGGASHRGRRRHTCRSLGAKIGKSATSTWWTSFRISRRPSWRTWNAP